MELPSILLSIAVVWGIAAATPGPNFFVTLRMAAIGPRRRALATVAGIVSGTLVWGLAGFFGISALFAAAPWLYLALKVAGGAYLIFLGLRLILASFRTAAQGEAPAVRPAHGLAAAWRLGLVTNLANPKTAAFVTSLFATTLPAAPTLSLGLLAAGVMGAVSLLWYGGVALCFGAPRMKGVYARIARITDRVAGGLFVAFGLRLALDR